MKILYYERTFIDDFRCIDEVKQIKAIRVFRHGNLLYAYLNQFKVAIIELDRIVLITCD